MGIALTLWAWLQVVTSLLCNQCFNADKPVDCKRTGKLCRPGQICFVDANAIKYEEGSVRERTLFMYKMGCAHASICKDGVSYGPGPYGYSRIVRSCCCTDKCSEPDGSGKGIYDKCHISTYNTTIDNGSITFFKITPWTTTLYSLITTLMFGNWH